MGCSIMDFQALEEYKSCWTSIGSLRYMGTPPSFSTMFTKGYNFHDFLFAYLEGKVSPKMRSTSKGKIPMGAFSFLYEMTPIHMKDKNENDSCFP